MEVSTGNISTPKTKGTQTLNCFIPPLLSYEAVILLLSSNICTICHRWVWAVSLLQVCSPASCAGGQYSHVHLFVTSVPCHCSPWDYLCHWFWPMLGDNGNERTIIMPLEVLPGCCKVSAVGESREGGGMKTTLTQKPFVWKAEKKVHYYFQRNLFDYLGTKGFNFFILCIRQYFEMETIGWETHRNWFFFSLVF